MSGRRGFTLIEIVVVMAIIAIALTFAGVRVSSGMGRLELEQAANSVKLFIRIARIEAQHSNREQYVLLDRQRHSVALLSPEMKIVREEKLPGSVEVVLDRDVETLAMYIAPSGLIRGKAIRLRGRTGEIGVAVQ